MKNVQTIHYYNGLVIDTRGPAFITFLLLVTGFIGQYFCKEFHKLWNKGEIIGVSDHTNICFQYAYVEIYFDVHCYFVLS